MHTEENKRISAGWLKLYQHESPTAVWLHTILFIFFFYKPYT